MQRQCRQWRRNLGWTRSQFRRRLCLRIMTILDT
jgi:hypothetical protein